MAKEYLWQGKYRTFSNVDPALYYPNGIDPGVSSGYGYSTECFRLEFPLSPSTYYYSGSDFPAITPSRKYFEQEDITDDPAWGLYLVQNTSSYISCEGATFADPGFLVITGDFSPDMILNLDTGKLIGRTAEMDQYVSGLNLPPDYKIDEQNYGTVGSASYFRNGVGRDIPIRFTARVFSKSNPSIYIDNSFEYGLRNNWSSDRDYLILNLKNQFYVNGVTATNLEYLQAQKAKGYFPGPPSNTPVTITETSGLASAPQFISAPTPKPIWTGTWYAPVSAGANTVQLENYTSDDFSKYQYVKPLIWLTAPNTSQSYIDDSATSYFTKAATPGSYKTRLDAIINGLNSLPSGMRTLAPYYYWNGYVYWANDTSKRSDFATFMTANPDYNTHPGRSADRAQGQFLFNRKSDNITGTGWAIASIWGATAVSQVSQDWAVMCAGLSARGANIDYITFDVEGFPGNSFDTYPPAGASFADALTTMKNDPRANADWYGARPLNTVLTQNGKYPNNTVTETATTTEHPQLRPSYIYWNGGLGSILNASLNACFWGTARQYYPNIGLSNYDSFKINDQDWAYDPYGHPHFQENNVGDGASPYLYASWNFNTTYSIDPTDNTKIVRNDTNQNTLGASYFPNTIWNCFLLDIQTVRAIRRADTSVKLRPWIRPRSWEGDGGFSVGITAGQGDSPTSGERFYYEILRHAAASGVEHFYYWNSTDYTVGGISRLQRNASEVNDIMTEVNTMLGGYSPEAITTSRISFKSDYVISGTKAAGGKNWNKYVWRVTPKPGITLYDNTGNALAVDSDGGAWVVTGTPNIPQYSIVPPVYSGDWAIQNYKNQYYAAVFPGYADPIDAQGVTWGNWDTNFISYFQGNPKSGQGIRAFPWENDPANPYISSPWHNAIYESVITWYRWGARSFHFHFPYGAYARETQINASGNAGVFFLSHQIRKDAYTLSTPGVTHTNPARWKGFPEAINALIEGRMIPVDGSMNPQTNKTQILEPCNVFLYIPTNMGYFDYRRKASKYWRSLTGTSAQKDSTYYLKLDGMIDTIKSMRSTISNGGKLSICMDVGSNIATPDSIALYRTIVDTTSSAGTDRDASYLSDALELSDWYVLTKLKEAGIDVYLEARYPKTRNKITYEISGISGSVGTTVNSGLLYNNFTSTEHYLWTSNQLTKTALPASIVQYGAKDDYVSNAEAPKIHRLNWQSYYMGSGGVYNDPYRAWHYTINGATAHDMWGMASDYTYYSPHAATFYLYALLDHHRHYKNLLQANRPTQVGVRLSNYNSIVFDPTWFANTQKPVVDTSDSSLNTYRTDLYVANPLTRVEGGNMGSFPPWNGLTFNSDQWSAGPTAYLQASTNGLKYWTLEGRNFWTNNVMKSSFDAFISMLDTVSATAAPFSAVAEGWAGATYPYDYYSKNIIGSVHGLPS